MPKRTLVRFWYTSASSRIAGVQPQSSVSKPVLKSSFHYLATLMSFETIEVWKGEVLAMTSGEKKQLLEAKVAITLENELG